VWWCECYYPPEDELETHGGVLTHLVCGLPVACDFIFHAKDPPHAASTIYVAYMVCDAHESVAEYLYESAG
jgi:hypothetical protein